LKEGARLNSEKLIRATLKRLAGQRISMVLQPGNVWVIESAVEDDNEGVDAAIKSAYLRGWVEPIENAVAKGKLLPGGKLPPGNPFQSVGALWRLTDAGWAVINRNQTWMLLAVLIAFLSFAVSIGSLVISLEGRLQK
jgi:hypothetical protein